MKRRETIIPLLMMLLLSLTFELNLTLSKVYASVSVCVFLEAAAAQTEVSNTNVNFIRLYCFFFLHTFSLIVYDKYRYINLFIGLHLYWIYKCFNHIQTRRY